MKILAFGLVNGREIVAELVEEEGDSLLVNNPLEVRLVPIKGENNRPMGFQLAMDPLAVSLTGKVSLARFEGSGDTSVTKKDTKVRFYKSSISWISEEIDQRIINNYLNFITGLVIPQGGLGQGPQNLHHVPDPSKGKRPR